MKPYDFKELLKELESEGREITEEAAKSTVKAVFAWLEKSAVASPTPYDDMLAVVYPQAKKYVLDAAEKINKEDN